MSLYDILFLDIETVPQKKDFAELPIRIQELWSKKSKFITSNEKPLPEDVYDRAGIYAEFGKIISISVGYFVPNNKVKSLRIKDFTGHDESLLLHDFKTLINTKFKKKDTILCAHNGKEFDFPYIARRMIINQIELPECLKLSGKKPWEIQHIDTMEMWKFGDYKHYTSLELLASIFNIPTSKDDIDGSQVYGVYYVDNDLTRIGEYCKKDVAVLAQVYLRLKGNPPLKEHQIIYIYKEEVAT
jgi:3'-5' exonuclease